MPSPDSIPSVLVVIVNYRTATLTIDCLRSIASDPDRLPRLRVVVTDNASGDDSVARLSQFVQQQKLTDWVTIQPLANNGGFAHGNNAAIRPALAHTEPPDYVLLLNPDTWIRDGAIRDLVSFLESHPEVGIAGSRLEDPDGTPQRSAFRFPSVAGELDAYLKFGPVSRLLSRYVVAPPCPEAAVPTDWVSGASMMVRREVFDRIGLLDEQYFMYFEEVDFCWRARQAGWSIWYVPQSRVVHLVGQASGINNVKLPPRPRPDYWFDSRRRFFLLHRGSCYTAACDVAMIGGMALCNLRCWIERRQNDEPPGMFRDSCRHSVLFRGFHLSPPTQPD